MCRVMLGHITTNRAAGYPEICRRASFVVVALVVVVFNAPAFMPASLFLVSWFSAGMNVFAMHPSRSRRSS